MANDDIGRVIDFDDHQPRSPATVSELDDHFVHPDPGHGGT
jgi:hypothetical protein